PGPDPASNSGPLSGPHPGMGGPSGPYTPARPFPPQGPTPQGAPYGPSQPQPYGAPTAPYNPYSAPGAPQRKQGMSTGAKVGIGVGGGILGLMVIMVVAVVLIAMSAGDEGGGTSSASPTASQTTYPDAPTDTPTDAPTEALAEPPAEGGVTVTATHAGTVNGTLDPAETYTALDVTFVNDSGEPFSVNPLYFTFILDDGTEVVDWELFADITQFEAADLAPGEQVSGQVAIAGEVTVAEVHYDPSFGMEEPIVVPVQ
ncbi:hypothetical protein, partial [Nocardiopsis sp. CC223A]|uniref:hypothetical protein n=1 Tax=Nocardiopsis sp. CC223A TaxID=3044051 RepID=UPI00278BCD9D